MRRSFVLLLWFCLVPRALPETFRPEKADGYHGIWYSNQPTGDEYVYKYSGGLATYPQQHSPIAIYAPAARKTFFCYGGSLPGRQELLVMVSYYDHVSRQVPRPRILLNRKTDDAHDNPVLGLDERGHVWVFANSHGTARRSYIFRSTAPYSIDEFERVWEGNFSYANPRWVSGEGFLFLHTRYERGGRSLYWMTSRDGLTWSEPQLLARVELGHYQIVQQAGRRVATAFNFHPAPFGLNARTNLYYLETTDMGRTWKTVDGRPAPVPVTRPEHPALVHDYRSEGLLVYLKTLEFDRAGRPVILFLTSRGFEPGPKNDPRVWRIAHWTGDSWEIRELFTSDHNYDFGSLYIEDNRVWRIIAPTDPGPQPYCTGGEMVMWISRDEGKTWQRARSLTRNSSRNHTYARKPVNAQPDFYALWADGDAKKFSDSALYFTNREGTAVWRLPQRMSSEFAKPERVR